MKKRKNKKAKRGGDLKKQVKKKIKKMMKNPEEAVFVGLVILSLFFVGLCFGNIKKDSDVAAAPAAATGDSSHLEREIKKNDF